jgi:hypothetical protein
MIQRLRWSQARYVGPSWGIEPQTYELRVNLQVSAQEAPAESAGRIHRIGCVSGMMTLQLVDSEPSLPTTATKVVGRARWRRVVPTASSTVRSLLVVAKHRSMCVLIRDRDTKFTAEFRRRLHRR